MKYHPFLLLRFFFVESLFQYDISGELVSSTQKKKMFKQFSAFFNTGGNNDCDVKLITVTSCCGFWYFAKPFSLCRVPFLLLFFFSSLLIVSFFCFILLFFWLLLLLLLMLSYHQSKFLYLHKRECDFKQQQQQQKKSA